MEKGGEIKGTKQQELEFLLGLYALLLAKNLTPEWRALYTERQAELEEEFNALNS